MCSMILGNSTIHDGVFITREPLEYEDYASWKADLLDNIFIDKKLSRRCSRRIINNTYEFSLKWDFIEKFLHKRCFNLQKNQKKVDYLLSQMKSPIHLAIFVMDRGYKNSKGLWIDLDGYTKGQINLIWLWLKSRFKIDSKRYKTKLRIYNQDKLLELCSDFLNQNQSIYRKRFRDYKGYS